MNEHAVPQEAGWSSMRLERPASHARALLWGSGLAAIVVGAIMIAVASDATGRAQVLASVPGSGLDATAQSSARLWAVLGIVIVTSGIFSLAAGLFARSAPRARAMRENGDPTASASRYGASVATELALLADLYAQGILSAEEFASAKRRLLDS